MNHLKMGAKWTKLAANCANFVCPHHFSCSALAPNRYQIISESEQFFWSHFLWLRMNQQTGFLRAISDSIFWLIGARARAAGGTNKRWPDNNTNDLSKVLLGREKKSEHKIFIACRRSDERVRHQSYDSKIREVHRHTRSFVPSCTRIRNSMTIHLEEWRTLILSVFPLFLRPSSLCSISCCSVLLLTLHSRSATDSAEIINKHSWKTHRTAHFAGALARRQAAAAIRRWLSR